MVHPRRSKEPLAMTNCNTFSGRHRITALTAVCLMSIMGQTLAADAWVFQRPIRMIVPFAAGTGTDVAACAVADELSRAGAAVVVDNIPGANGILGAQQAARSAADGHTLFLGTSTTHAANAALYRKLPYDPVKDFDPVAKVAEAPLALVVPVDSPYRQASDFLDAVKARKPLAFASSSGATRIAGEMLKTSLKGDLINVPYKSSPQALTDLMGGRVDFMVCDLGAVLPIIKTGRVRALAVTAPRRDPQLPEVPTFPEAGLEAFELMTWVAVFVPAGTSGPAVEQLGSMLRTALAQPRVQERLSPMGVTTSYAPSRDMRSYLNTELARWKQAAQAAGIQPE